MSSAGALAEPSSQASFAPRSSSAPAFHVACARAWQKKTFGWSVRV